MTLRDFGFGSNRAMTLGDFHLTYFQFTVAYTEQQLTDNLWLTYHTLFILRSSLRYKDHQSGNSWDIETKYKSWSRIPYLQVSLLDCVLSALDGMTAGYVATNVMSGFI